MLESEKVCYNWDIHGDTSFDKSEEFRNLCLGDLEDQYLFWILQYCQFHWTSMKYIDVVSILKILMGWCDEN